MTQQRAGLMVLAIKVNEVVVEAMLGRAELLPEQAEHTREEIVDAPERAMPCRYSRSRPMTATGLDGAASTKQTLPGGLAIS